MYLYSYNQTILGLTILYNMKFKITLKGISLSKKPTKVKINTVQEKKAGQISHFMFKIDLALKVDSPIKTHPKRVKTRFT